MLGSGLLLLWASLAAWLYLRFGLIGVALQGLGMTVVGLVNGILARAAQLKKEAAKNG